MTPRVLFSDILYETARFHGMSVKQLLNPGKARFLARARQHAMFLARRFTALSHPEIARRMGGFDHTTIIHGVRKISELVAADHEVAAVSAKIESRLFRLLEQRTRQEEIAGSFSIGRRPS